ncbi:MAG: sulfurtransferase [Thermomonas sp.]
MMLNIAAYVFVAVDDADALSIRVREKAEAAALRGSVLVAPEGINLFLAGREAPLRGFIDWLREDPRFAGINIKESWSEVLPFARLKVKRKDEIIAFRRDGAVPIERERAPAVEPRTLARWIEQGHDDVGKPLVLLDTRNREEVGFGSFVGALTLPIDNFTELPDAIAPHREVLRNATVVSFCTGGIRCEKAALWLRDDGMDNLLQLDGGILGYFEQVGGFGYDGRCFVFDERVALDPCLQPLVDHDAAA